MQNTLPILSKIFFWVVVLQVTTTVAQQKFSKRQIQRIKAETLNQVQYKHKQTQIMVDKIFSFD